MDQLVDYARSGKGQDGQGSASQAQTRSTSVKRGVGPLWRLGGTSVVQVQELERTRVCVDLFRQAQTKIDRFAG